MPRYTAVPAIAYEGLTGNQGTLLTTIKENIELLTGTRNEADSASRAVTWDQITIDFLGEQELRQVTATGAGVRIGGANVPTLADHGKLVNDLQVLANDLFHQRIAFNALLQQLKGV